MYGWYGQFHPRDSYGELPANQQPSFVQYIEYDVELFEIVVADNDFNPLNYRVEFVPNVPTTPPPPLTTEGPPPAEGIPMIAIVGVGVGGGLAALVIVLIIVLVIVFGRGRKKKPKKKKRTRYAFMKESMKRERERDDII